MPMINFKAHGITLWADYTAYRDEPELLAITLDDSDVDIEPLVGSDIIEMAYAAIEQAIRDIDEHRRQSVQEMRYYDEQG